MLTKCSISNSAMPLPLGTSVHSTFFHSQSTTPQKHSMARRAAPANATPAFFAAPARRQIVDPNESALSRFIREQITAPEKLPGNISIVTGMSVFVAGIFVARTWGDMLVPA
ncbi:uncharacterized protein BJ212DRAFT_342449 [Suillus subaureus]|uniref:Uncharacterized protein n=1 Tax=Suillus subaureus TaxID=48587 RepID=A0A9P7E923_9AGAM|nr:uncharacterized protein BJ212DRAFT_342449 [Suillus subaureus]KAG1814618.1 hypothetical protein BJ212DRAFT_342449 [Suillus subaureus]